MSIGTCQDKIVSPMAQNSNYSPTELEQHVREALQNRNRIDRLQNSPLLALPLVEQRRSDEQLARYEALQVVFDAILLELRQSNSDYADLLHGRYWEGVQVKKMVADERPVSWSESSFYNHQARAIQQFALIFQEQNALAARQQPVLPISAPEESTQIDADATVGTTASLPQTPKNVPPGSMFSPTFTWSSLFVRHPYLLYLSLFLLVSIPIAWFLLSYRLESNRIIGTVPPPIAVASHCGEEARLETPPPPAPRFLASQGVSLFTPQNTPGGLLSNFVRVVTFGPTGLWLGYHAPPEQMNLRGLSHFDKKAWSNCNRALGPLGKNVNDVLLDRAGKLWVSAEQTGGVLHFDGQRWHSFTIEDGLPSNDTFYMAVDQENNVWVSTYQGVAKYDGHRWSVPYTRQNGTLFSDHVHDIAFDKGGGIWVGHHDAGISYLPMHTSEWIQITTADGLGSNKVRRILMHTDKTGVEAVWVATKDGGISERRNLRWTQHTQRTGLPSDVVEDLAVDKHGRVWAATAAGVAYWNGVAWHRYHELPAISVAFGLRDCNQCPYDDDHVVTGTIAHGFTHSRLPYPTAAVGVDMVCFVVSQSAASDELPPVCPESQVDTSRRYLVTYPQPLTPGTVVRLEITINVMAPYQLQEKRGDYLSNLADVESERHGAWSLMPVRGTVEPGQSFTFTSYDNPLTIPTLAATEPLTLTSSWRVWTHTRYAGPRIDLLLPVQPADTGEQTPAAAPAAAASS